MTATPIDPTLPEAGALLRTALGSGSVTVPGMTVAGSEVSVTALGAGESYAAWLVAGGPAPVVFRLARRPVADLPCPMEDELRAAPFIPEGAGSRPLAMDASEDNPLGFPYIVSSYVPGRVRAPSEWDLGLLRAHARRLAELHRPAFATAGRIGGAGTRLSIVEEFDGGWRWWGRAHPEIAERQDDMELAGAIRTRLRDAEPAFEGIHFSFIHADLVATNVLVDRGFPRYIDWEWARIGDVANDLALIGGTVTGGPWYVPMDDATIQAFLAEYLAARRDRDGAVEDGQQLRIRRDAWELTERFLTSLHFETKAADPGYADAVVGIRGGLKALLCAGAVASTPNTAGSVRKGIDRAVYEAEGSTSGV